MLKFIATTNKEKFYKKNYPTLLENTNIQLKLNFILTIHKVIFHSIHQKGNYKNTAKLPKAILGNMKEQGEKLYVTDWNKLR